MAVGTAAVLGGTALLGALAGSQKDVTSQSLGINVGAESDWEKRMAASQGQQFSQLESLIGKGPGAQDVTAALGSQRDLASMLSAFSKGGFMPGEAEFAQARQFGGQVFAPQEVALRQSMEEARTQAGRQAALMGRGGADPVLQAKLAQQQMQGQERISAQRGAYEAQFALGLPQQRLEYASQLAQVRGGLATQAMQNRQTLLGLGNQLRQQERDWRLQTATKNYTTESGGGLKGAISGGLSGLGAGLSMASGLGGLGGAGGGFSPSAGITSAFSQSGAQAGGQALGMGAGMGAQSAMAGMQPGMFNAAAQAIAPTRFATPMQQPISSYIGPYGKMGSPNGPNW